MKRLYTLHLHGKSSFACLIVVPGVMFACTVLKNPVSQPGKLCRIIDAIY